MDEEVKVDGSLDINQALQEFEEKSEAEKVLARTQEVVEKRKLSSIDMPKMAAFVIKVSGGKVKNRKQAEYILLAFVVLSLFISFFIFQRKTASQTEFKAIPGYRVTYPNNAPPRLEPIN